MLNFKFLMQASIRSGSEAAIAASNYVQVIQVFNQSINLFL